MQWLRGYSSLEEAREVNKAALSKALAWNMEHRGELIRHTSYSVPVNGGKLDLNTKGGTIL